MQETQVWSLGQEDPLEEEVATLPGEFHQTQLSIDRHIHCNGYIGIYVTLTNNKSYTRLFSSVHFGRSVVSDSLRPHGLQHARLPCPSPTPRVYSNSCSLSLLKLMFIELVMPFNHLILCRPLLLLPSIILSIRVFSNESVLRLRWPKYWNFSFSISPANEYSGLISFRMDWLVGFPCCPRDSQESSPTPQFKSINSSVFSFLYTPTLTFIHDHWKNHSFIFLIGSFMEQKF